MNEPTPPLRPRKRLDLSPVHLGERFGRGVVIEVGLKKPARNQPPWMGASAVLLVCDCGNEYLAAVTRLRSGSVNSCGCLRRDRQREAVTKHGLTTHVTSHPLYRTWYGMVQRCENPDDVHFPGYGGRGIRVCERWHDPRPFIEDIERLIGVRPAGKTLDRVNNNGNYEPGNVRWATPKEQAANRRPSGRDFAAWSQEQWDVREPRTEVCEHCGSEFQTRSVKRVVRFCSSRCSHAFYVAEGRYDEERICHWCGATFTILRYKEQRHCSRSCGVSCSRAGGCPR